MRGPRPIADPDIEAYATEHSSPEPPWLLAAAQRTDLFSPQSGMMVGPLQGRLLSMLVGISGARRVLEIGTFTGYSAIFMADALPEDGRIITCELHPEHAAQAQANINASPHANRIEVRVGPALETIAALDAPFDLVFIDAHKAEYTAYYEAVLPLLAPRGLIVVDNVLWKGMVLDRDDPDASTAAIDAFNALVADDPRVECVMLTIRDGLSLIRRRAAS
jgi:caffeoyl-CoA O-methyltransferase